MLVAFCSGVPGGENGGRAAYGFVVASCVGPPKPSRRVPGPRRYPGGGGKHSGPVAGGLKWEIERSWAALLGDASDVGPYGGLGEETLLSVSEYRAVGAALSWIEGRGRLGERVVVFTGSKTLAKRGEEPFGVWRASRRPIEGAALKEVLAALSRLGDVPVEWWGPESPERPAGLVALAGEAAGEIPAKARVAVLEEGRRVRAKGVKLQKIGRGLYRANGRYVVDALLGFCGCRDFEINNGKKRKAGVPLVRCKHLIAAEKAHNGEAEERPRRSGQGVLGPTST